jgi:hypothetical protein
MLRRKFKIEEPVTTKEIGARDGVSEYTHAAAHGRVILRKSDPPPEQPPRWRTYSQLIARNRHELKKIEAKLAGDLSHADRARLESNKSIKVGFIAKLLAEYEEMVRTGAREP